MADDEDKTPEQRRRERKEAAKRRKAKKARNKVDKPTEEELEIEDFWERYMVDMPVRNYQWRVVAYKGNAVKWNQFIRLDPMITAMSWEDELVQKVSMSLTNPARKLNILEGHLVTVFVAPKVGGKWTKLFTLRISELNAGLAAGSLELTTSDELDYLKRSKDDFAYRKGKGKSPEKRANGWRAHQITRDVCKRYGIKVGKLVKGTKEINKLVETGVNPISIIEKVYEEETKETGFKYIIKMRQGRLYVTRLRRSRELLVYGRTAIDGSINRKMKKNMATELVVTGKIKGEGDDSKKVEKTIKASKKIQRRYGYIRNTMTLEEPVESLKEFNKAVKEEYADRIEPDRDVQLTVPGNPYLRMGDAVRAHFVEEAFDEIMYVKGASHSVAGGDYTTDLTLSFDEYYIDKEGEAIREKICKKAEKAGRKGPWFCEEDVDVFSPVKIKPTKQRNRGDSHSKKRKKARR